MTRRTHSFRFLCVQENRSGFFNAKTITQDQRRRRSIVTGVGLPIMLTRQEMHNYARKEGCSVLIRVKGVAKS